MASKNKEAASGEGKSEKGRAIILPNGEKRVDYIRTRYYDDGIKRGAIRTEVNEMLTAAGLEDDHIPYQIVFAATKTEEKPVPKPRVKKEEAVEEETA